MPKAMWGVAICSSRESLTTLSACLDSVIEATSTRACGIDLLVNGNPETARAIGLRVDSTSLNGNISVRVWHIPLADKANAWNWYLHDIWPGSDLVFFVDGYVRIASDAFWRIERIFADHPESLAASGVPAAGRSASLLHRQSAQTAGIHGNLFCVRGATWTALRARGFRFPLGIYWSDGLIGAIICFGLDPARRTWDFRRILTDPAVNWTFDALKWWHPNDLRSYLKRVLRQARGKLENRAIRQHLEVRGRPAEDLAPTASALVEGWFESCPTEAMRLLVRHPACLLALWNLRKRRDWSMADAQPQLITDTRSRV